MRAGRKPTCSASGKARPGQRPLCLGRALRHLLGPWGQGVEAGLSQEAQPTRGLTPCPKILPLDFVSKVLKQDPPPPACAWTQKHVPRPPQDDRADHVLELRLCKGEHKPGWVRY